MKKLNVEYVVGLFVIGGFLSFVWMSLQLGEFSIFSMKKTYTLIADFGNVSGLKEGATLEMAGVTIGKVSGINLGEHDRAQVHMQIDKSIKITEDAIASIKTQGIIGDKYIQISQGGSDELLKDGAVITETESAIDLEELVSKYVFGDLGK